MLPRVKHTMMRPVQNLTQSFAHYSPVRHFSSVGGANGAVQPDISKDEVRHYGDWPNAQGVRLVAEVFFIADYNSLIPLMRNEYL